MFSDMRRLALAAVLLTAFSGAAFADNDNAPQFVQVESVEALVAFSQNVGSVGFVFYGDDVRAC